MPIVTPLVAMVRPVAPVKWWPVVVLAVGAAGATSFELCCQESCSAPAVHRGNSEVRLALNESGCGWLNMNGGTPPGSGWFAGGEAPSSAPTAADVATSPAQMATRILRNMSSFRNRSRDPPSSGTAERNDKRAPTPTLRGRGRALSLGKHPQRQGDVLE